MTATQTEQRKTAAIQAMHADICPPTETGPLLNPEYDTPEKMAARIRELAPVIRSEKWRDAVEHYAYFVETEGKDGRLSWAYFQGSVYFAHMVM